MSVFERKRKIVQFHLRMLAPVTTNGTNGGLTNHTLRGFICAEDLSYNMLKQLISFNLKENEI